MSKNRELGILIMLILGILFTFSPVIFINNLRITARNRNIISNYNDDFDHDDFKISAVSGKIHIDNNWTAAKSAGICTGEGTLSNPYIIQNFEIDAGGSGDCILIENSLVYFIIRNCILSNSGSESGIKLYNVKNGEITYNEATYCGAGIELSTNFPGVTSDIVISRNNLHNSGCGIQLYGASNSEVIGNTINNNDYGIYLSYGDYNNISENVITDNSYGISSYANWDFESEYNTISSNLIQDNSNFGVFLNDYVDLNYVFLNCFIDNGLNAYDEGSNNQWDNGVKGNYWSNYTGSDTNGDGIGDVPYDISGSVGSQDNFPLMTCPISTSHGIPSYNLFLLFGILSIAAILITKKVKKP
ncbi:MAG: right-handed parallel beta-helix repeat-containing protein [Promethearchaeota archaeon]|nr:MAG: right-handed parallel beta-helix repeat-containing protein [Candidatus Lokiarchaeota archaeon]